MPLRVPIDRLANPIPPWCERAFETCESIARCLRKIDSALEQLKLRKRSGNPGTELFQPEEVQESVREALLPLLLAQPWSVCQRCARNTHAATPTCPDCHGRGWLTRAETEQSDYNPWDSKGGMNQHHACRRRVRELEADLRRISARVLGTGEPPLREKLQPEALKHVQG